MRAEVRVDSDSGTWSSGELQLSELADYSLIEVPGRVENPDNLVAGLGGYPAICECALDPRFKPLALRLCPEDPYSKFIPANTNKSLGIVLKLRKRKDGSAAELVCCGVVRQSFRFTTMADYYLAPEDAQRYPSDDVFEMDKVRQAVISARRPEPTSSGPGSSTSRVSAATLLLEAETRRKTSDLLGGFDWKTPIPDPLPPVFTRQCQPHAYRYDINHIATSAKYFPLPGDRLANDDFGPFELPAATDFEEGENSHMSQSLISSCRQDGGVVCNATARIGDKEFPRVTGAPVAVLAAAQMDQSMLEEVRALFTRRPIWQRVSLMANLSKPTTLWRLKPLLAITCFIFLDGPFRGCLCRMGYDPRLDKESRFYQSIDFRDVHFRSLQYKTQKGSRSDASKEEFTDYQFLRAASKPSCFYQFADIDDANIQLSMKMAKPLAEFSNTTGWFSEDTIARIRDMMAIRSKTLREAELAQKD